MITGFNTDVEHAGKKFHVQTQEQGQSNPVVETLVYAGGAIVTFVANSYADIVERSGHARNAILERMEDQHEMLIRQVLEGEFDPAPKPYGHAEVTHLLAKLQDRLTEIEPVRSGSTETPVDVKLDRLRRVLTRLERRIDEDGRTADRDATGLSTREVARTATLALARPVSATRTAGTTGRVWAVAAVACAILAVVLFGVSGERFAASRSAPPTWEQSRTVEEQTPADSREAVPLDLAPIESAAPDGTAGADPSTAPPPRIVRPAPPPLTPTRKSPAKKTSPPAALPEPEPLPSNVEESSDGAHEPFNRAHDKLLGDAQPGPAAMEPQRTIAVPPTRRGQLVDYSEIDVEPVPVRRDLPRYTRKARRQGRQGVVGMRILVIENGAVAHAELVEEIPDSDLGDAAIEATRTWQFTPARKDGVPVRVWKDVRVRFAISSSGKAIVRVEE